MSSLLMTTGFLSLCLPWVGAQDVDVCPDGWEAAVRTHLVASLDGDFEAAASFVLAEERQAWLEWQVWKEKKLSGTLAGMAPELQERQAAELARQRQQLEVSHCLCEQKKEGGYRVRIDPNGRSFRVLNMQHGPDEGWQVETRHVLLDGEQRRMVTAFMRAVDERRWEEAEAWMAEEAMPRFKGYQLEVETFLKGSAFLSETRQQQSTLRETEWEDVMLWAEREPDGVVVVHAEFRTAASLSCEMRESDGVWRTLMR